MTSLVLLEKSSEMDNDSLQQIFKHIPLLKYWYRGSFHSDYVPTLDNDTFAIINTQHSNMQGEHWIMIAKSRHISYFADFLGRPSFQQYKQLKPEALQSHTNVCGFYAIYSAFHLFKFRQVQYTGVHNVNVLPFISNYL